MRPVPRHRAPRVQRSTVIDSVTGQSKVDPIRTSEQTFLNRGKYPIVTKIEERLARITHLPAYHGEDMQILKYGLGQKYDAHHDVGELDSKSGAQLASEGGHRVMTVLLYLSDVEEGGETAFPDSEWIDPSMGETRGPWSDCAEDHVAVKPKKGDGLLFYSVTPDYKIDPKSMHTGCPVIRGTKWTATKWIHAKPFRWHARRRRKRRWGAKINTTRARRGQTRESARKIRGSCSRTASGRVRCVRG